MTRPAMIYVLNLDRAPDRWHGSLQRLERLGIGRSMIQRVAGFDALDYCNAGKSPPHRRAHLIERLADEGVIREGEIPHLGPDFCIAASHLRVLRRVRDEGHARSMVLEDDFEFTRHCRSRADLLNHETLAPDAEWLWLHDCIAAHRRDQGRIRRAVGGHGTIAYLVSHKGAMKAREALLPTVAPCDLQLAAFGRWFHSPALRERYITRKLPHGRRNLQAEKSLFLQAYGRFPPLFTQRRGPSLKHEAAREIFVRSYRAARQTCAHPSNCSGLCAGIDYEAGGLAMALRRAGQRGPHNVLYAGHRESGSCR